MNTPNMCPIWGTDCTLQSHGYGTLVDSKRAGGKYFITIDIARQISSGIYELKDRDKAVLTTWIVNQQRQGEIPRISPEIIDRVTSRELKPMNPYHRADSLLRVMDGACEPGQNVGLRNLTADWDVLVLTESTSNRDAELLVDSLVDRGRLHASTSGTMIRITLDGYQRLSELDNLNADSRQVFVAMWFHDSTNELRRSIKQSIETVGLVPYIVDEESFENKICDKIEVEIRRSRLLIADFTHDEDGARGSVYYEAGLAMGLGLPVIWTCRESQIEELHFDIRQYPHLGWDDSRLTDFRDRLSDRLRIRLSSGDISP